MTNRETGYEEVEETVDARVEARFRRIFEHFHDAFFLIDPAEGRLLDANERACELLEYPREELLALPVTAVHPEAEKLGAFAERVVRDGEGFTDELTCLTRSGAAIPAEISAAAVQLDGRRCIAAAVRDVSARVEAEEARRLQRERLEALVDERTAELRRSERRSRLLLDITTRLAGQLERDHLFGAVTEALRRTLEFDRASLSLLDEERGVFRTHALAGTSDSLTILPEGAELPVEGSRLGDVLASGRAKLIPDLTERADRTPFEERLVAAGLRSTLLLPLLAGDRRLGVLAIGSTTAGRFDQDDAGLLTEIVGQVSLAVEKMLAYEQISRLKAQLEREKLYLQEEIKTEHNFEEIVGESPPLLRALRAVETVAPTDANVLVCGETGTGKELIARALHDLSGRRGKPLVKVNCAAIPAGLVESEFFGHEKGAFTGAVSRKIGRFELADGGTIFLDEIGDLPLDLQSKLLRVLQEGEFERIGSARTLGVDVRVIAATNRDLEAQVREGRFRSDLYYRLAVFPIELPPLRERRGDIRLLVNYFATKFGRRLGKPVRRVPPAVMRQLESYDWPGNVRELQNVIERAVILSRGEELPLGRWFPGASPAADPPPLELDEVQRRHIVSVLERTGWKVSGPGGAAELLAMKPTTLEYRMKKLGIERPG